MKAVNTFISLKFFKKNILSQSTNTMIIKNMNENICSMFVRSDIKLGFKISF
jgi:hypothetical protein